MISAEAGIAVGCVIAWATGWFLVRATRRAAAWPLDPLDACSAAILGLAVHSAGYFLWAAAVRTPTVGWLVVDGLLLAGSIVGWRVRRQVSPAAPSSPTPPRRFHQTAGKMACLVVLGLASWFTGEAVIGYLAREPFGRWDAWAMWNYKASMLHLAPGHVGSVFASPFPHPDYPWLLPASIARLWRWAGGQTLLGPHVMAVSATLLTLWLMAAGVSRLRGLGVATVASLVLLSAMPLARHGGSQYADTWVGCILLATLVALALWRERSDAAAPLLMGLLAGAAAWTKNEGVSWACGLLLVTSILAMWSNEREKAWRPLTRVVAGLLPWGVLLVVLKLTLSGRGTDLFGGLDPQNIVANLTDGSRYDAITRAARGIAAGVVHGPTVALFLGAAAVAWVGTRRRGLSTPVAVAAVLVWQGLTFGAVYLLLSRTLSWHLQTAADRLVIQLWPGMVFAAALLFPAAAPPERESSGRTGDHPLRMMNDSQRRPQKPPRTPVPIGGGG